MFQSFCILLALLSFTACGAGSPSPSPQTAPILEVAPQEAALAPEKEPAPEVPPAPSAVPGESQAVQEEPVLLVGIGDAQLEAVWEDNPSAEAFRQLLEAGPVTVEMEDYGGFEKVGPLGTQLTQSDAPITAVPGDVILYQGDKVTLYYGTNSWNFTRLAKVTDPDRLGELLEGDRVTVTFSLGEGA